MKRPRAFISYSHTSQEYKAEILRIANELASQGVEIVIDAYDLKPGHDIAHFMERMVNDPLVTHCLLFCDSVYVKKANGRAGGVGGESQIVSAQLYTTTTQTRFVPIIMEWIEGESPVPTYVGNRYFFDFSSPEKRNRDWDSLIRHLWNKPLLEKPVIGPRPAFLDNPAISSFGKSTRILARLKEALSEALPRAAILREELLDCVHAEIHEAELVATDLKPDQAAWDDLTKNLIPAKEILIDWMLVEVTVSPSAGLKHAIIPILENIGRVDQSQEWTFRSAHADGRAIFAYEIAINAIAVLLRADATSEVSQLLSYPFTHLFQGEGFKPEIGLTAFYHYSRVCEANSSQGRVSATGSFVTSRVLNAKVPAAALVEADALICVHNRVLDLNWWPALAFFVTRGKTFPWFRRARYQKSPDRMLSITSLSWTETRDQFLKKFNSDNASALWFTLDSYLKAMCFTD